ncbi:MAG: Stp1/IreP family PP2C-type Ser/Thr phosphatase [Ilumatobacter sp.]|nr:Stp1/IreP family PP2C-type Ser/Thr phosphatase [Ilumatobacter sp.]
MLRWGSASDAGQLRAQNEDHAHAGEGLFVVADGMGGHLAGEVASEMAVKKLDERLPITAESSLDDLVEAIAQANEEIYSDSIDDPDRAGMGTTVTAVAVVRDLHDGEAFGVANVGDSRSYVLRHGRLRQLTIDHSFVQELVAEGAITRDEARFHPRRNIVTRALGIEPYVRVDSWTMPIIRGDRLVLCSDGLVDEITDDAISEILHAHPDDPQSAAQALVDAANDAGGRDNITVVVVDVLEGDDPPDPTEEFDVVPMWDDDDLDTTGETQIVADPLDDEANSDDDSDEPAGDDLEITTGVAALYDGDRDVTPAPGAKVPIVDGSDDGRSAGGTDRPPKKRRGVRLVRFVLAIGVAAVLILGSAIFAAWARSGYFVAFDDDGQVVIYQGRQGGVLWFDPTEEAVGQFGRDELDDESIELVEERPEFSSQASAELFVAERLRPAADDPDERDDVETPTDDTRPRDETDDAGA